MRAILLGVLAAASLLGQAFPNRTDGGGGSGTLPLPAYSFSGSTDLPQPLITTNITLSVPNSNGVFQYAVDLTGAGGSGYSGTNFSFVAYDGTGKIDNDVDVSHNQLLLNSGDIGGFANADFSEIDIEGAAITAGEVNGSRELINADSGSVFSLIANKGTAIAADGFTIGQRMFGGHFTANVGAITAPDVAGMSAEIEGGGDSGITRIEGVEITYNLGGTLSGIPNVYGILCCGVMPQGTTATYDAYFGGAPVHSGNFGIYVNDNNPSVYVGNIVSDTDIIGAAYFVGATAGVSCPAGVTAGTVRVIFGIVTHC